VTAQKKCTLADVRKAAARIGGAVDEQSSGLNGRTFTVLVDSPAGTVWNATGCHVVCELTADGPADWRYKVCAAAIEQMEQGTSACDDPECDHCHPVED
jgi:hypothetical protein